MHTHRRSIVRIVRATMLLLLVLLTGAACRRANESSISDSSDAWKRNWEIEKGMSLSIDTRGFNFPTGIAFVKNPGSGPKAPLYFVAEYHNRVKVVSNDRTVSIFAENFYRSLPRQKKNAASLSDKITDQLEANEPDHLYAAGGITGICLDSANGYVFVAFAYGDGNGVLRSNLIRFQCAPRTFSLKPTGAKTFAEIFESEPTAFSHNIGNIQILDEQLFVGIGDGLQAAAAGDTGSMHGKVFRMSLEGGPLRDNPFYVSDDRKIAANYVWASGLRNPFSLKIVGDDLFVVDNGMSLDRFLKIARAENYLWNGRDWDIGAKAQLTFHPAIGPTQLDYCTDADINLPAEYNGKFVVGSATGSGAGIVLIDYNPKNGSVKSAPRHIVQSTSSRPQRVVGLALGPDGMYFASADPGLDGTSSILKLAKSKNENDLHHYLLGDRKDSEYLLQKYACLSCHSLNPNVSRVGPSLDRESLVERVEARVDPLRYQLIVAEIDKLKAEPHISYSGARQEVLRALGKDRVSLWIKYHIMEPRFDQVASSMPNLRISEAEATILAERLVSGRANVSARQVDGELVRLLIGQQFEQVLGGPPRFRHLVVAFAIGLVVSGSGIFFVLWYLKRKRDRE